MKINRLFEIVYMLLDRKTMTAKDLADYFEVSTRTIYRDIETLSMAGIPIYMTKGKGGGIQILDNFVLNKSILSDTEQNHILSALQGLKAAQYPEADAILAKLSLVFNKQNQNWIEVDFSNWVGNDTTFDVLKSAILEKKIIAFDYYSGQGEKTHRQVEPLQLLFKEKAWYLKGFCHKRQDLRIFKLSRIKGLALLEEHFTQTPEEEEKHLAQMSDVESQFFEHYHKKNPKFIKIHFKLRSNQAHRVYDEFEQAEINKNPDGSFHIQVTWPDEPWLFPYILSFGDNIQILEPASLRKKFKIYLENMLKNYTS